MPGHVFITLGDLTKLRCDAWLLPCDAARSVADHWTTGFSSELKERLKQRRLPVPPGWGDHGVRVLPLPWSGDPPRPRPYLVNVGQSPGTPVEWYVEGVRQFLESAHETHLAHWQPERRAKPLVGLPLVGTGGGGAREIKGEMVGGLLEELYRVTRTRDVDVALVLKGAVPLAFAQYGRWKRGADDGARQALWPDLDNHLLGEARRLAEHASKNRLVLFVGAGVSRGAGLPDWGDLLDKLAEEVGMGAVERDALRRIPAVDRARIIESRLANRGAVDREKGLGTAIARHLDLAHYGLSHSLLAALPLEEVVTTNYDRLFEAASADADRPVAVLPYDPVEGRKRWLLKLHGCITHPADIVLTRRDYLRYEERRAALAGIVQAMLITRHMLFVGFSLADDNFHRIADDVHEALSRPGRPPSSRPSNQPVSGEHPFGTALFLARDPLVEELWRGDLRCVSVGETVDPVDPAAARRLEIFLDYLLAEATRDRVPLLDDSFSALLTPEEREIRELLRRLETSASEPVRSSPSWRWVDETLRRYRGKPAQPE